MEQNAKIYIAGHQGLVGSAIVRKLESSGYSDLILKTHAELDLTDAANVDSFFDMEKPDYVFLAAAKVGGIEANRRSPAGFYYENSMIANNVIHSSYVHKVRKLLFLGSSCIYPKDCSQPIKEEYLLSGALESTNEAYAIAKIAGLKMCSYYKQQYGVNFISAMPTNLYGPGDNFDLKTSHVLPALIRKFLEAKENNSPSVEIWGSGKPMREFLHVDDLAEAAVFLMNNYNGDSHVNVGTGTDISIKGLAELIMEITGYEGELRFNTSMPDGTYRKLLDVSKLKELGWESQITLEDGIKNTIDWYQNK